MTTLLLVTAWMATLVLVAIWIIALHNARTFPHLSTIPAPSRSQPSLTVLIPARNEAANIGRIVREILAQDYPYLRLLILDDQSEDNTAALAQNAAHGDPRFVLLHGEPLPAGWFGKSWACAQLACHANTEYLLFTDADVTWRPGAITALMDHAQQTQADLLTVWPTQVTITWSERLVVPMMAFVLLSYLPIRWAHSSLMASAAAANGQALLFRRAAYTAIGGHAAVAHNVLDDIGLALAVKRANYRLRMIDGAGLIACRMYRSFPEVIAGYAKNILAAHNDRISLLMLSTLFHLILFAMPVLWLVVATAQAAWGQALWSLTLVALGIGLRALTAQTAGLRVRDAWTLPISVLLLGAIALYAVWSRAVHGGPTWKGRRIVIPQGSGYEHS